MAYLPFIYREFYDVPRMLLVRHRDQLLLLESQFDDEADEYSTSYTVFVMPNLTYAQIAGSWVGFSNLAATTLGCLPVSEVIFDPSKRHKLDDAVLDRLFDQA